MFKKFIILFSILFIISGNPIYADEIVVPTQPDVTDKTPQEANEEITKYNEEVDVYNEKVDEYNAQIDSDYEKAVEIRRIYPSSD